MNEKDVVLEARGVEKSYRDDATAVPVLRGVNLAVHRGETVAILGTSGSGKSTLLHALGGLDTVDAGEVTVAGESMTGLSSNARGRLRNAHLGFVYQFHHLLPEFTALDNVAMPLWIRRLPKEEARERARKLLAAPRGSPAFAALGGRAAARRHRPRGRDRARLHSRRRTDGEPRRRDGFGGVRPLFVARARKGDRDRDRDARSLACGALRPHGYVAFRTHP